MTVKSRQTPTSPMAATPATTARATTGTTVAEDAAGAPANPASITDLDPADPFEARANVAGLAVLRLGKAMVGATVAAGQVLGRIEQDLGTEFPTFIAAKTMLTAGEARTMVSFAAQAGLQPDGLTAAVAVPLGRVLEAVALLGQLYVAEMEQGDDVPLEN
jgi:hypothetical protein